MKKTVCIAMAVLAMAGGGVAYAVSGTAQDRPAATATAQKQTTFAIENMTCATCPITVKKAMERSEEHTSELQSRPHLVCRLLLEKKNSPAARLLAQYLGPAGHRRRGGPGT